MGIVKRWCLDFQVFAEVITLSRSSVAVFSLILSMRTLFSVQSRGACRGIP